MPHAAHDVVAAEAADDAGLLLDALPIAYLRLDSQFRLTYLNRAAEELFGWTRTEMIGRDPFKIIVAPEYIEFVHALRELMANGELEGPSFGENVTKDGRRFLSEWTNIRMVGSDGSFQGLLCTCVDVSERTRTTQALEHSEQRYRSLIDCLPDAILVTRGLTVAFVNPAGVELFGARAAADLVGKWLPELVHRDFQHVVSPTGDIAQASTMQRVQLLALGGRSVPAEIASIPLGDDPDSPGSLIVIRDMSERDALERELLQKQKLETMGQLAGGIAHDFNNLLTVILSACSLLQGRNPGDERAVQELALIREAAESASSLTRQLLAFARRQNVEHTLVDLNELIGTAMMMLERVLGEDVEITVERGADILPVCADARQLEQLIVNLAANARAAMPNGGRLTIATRNVVIERDRARRELGEKPGRYTELTVSDTGLGMDHETLAHIFEPFFTTKTAGSGLGLATCYGIVAQAGGSIHADSEPGNGSVFRILLPALEEEVVRERRKTVPPRSTDGTETVLLVDDNLALRSVAARILEQAGYRVLTASGSNHALDIARDCQERIDVLLTDVVMPGMSGTELAPKLREQRPNLVVLYMSGYTDDRAERVAAAIPEGHFVQKPFTPRMLLDRLRSVLDAPKVATNKTA